jgi:peptide/nickel transport system substrate-binding protein
MIFAWINMKDKTKLGLTITLLVIICTSTLSAFVSATGPATDTIEYVRVDRPLAPDALRNGDIDVYIFDILPEAQIEIGTEDPDIEFWEGISGMQCIALNPAPAPEGELNPFSITEIRYAMNFIFDRDFIVDEIYKGTAAKMYDYLGPYHPEVPDVADIKLTHGFVYNYEIANEMVENSMVLAGAEKRAGRWYYKDALVTIKAMIRVEDERRDMGDMFAAELDKLGFTIDYLHTTFGPAIDTIYGTDPADFEWSFYTEGFGLGASRWNTWEPGCWGGSADPDIGDWCANMPGWGVEEWWNYLSPGGRIEILNTDIYYGRYDDIEDRRAKIREVTDLMMQESVRIFGIRQLTAYPARRDVMGLTQDMGQGLRGAVWTPREAYREGDDTLTFANLWVWTESTNWNLYGGFNDVYSVDIARSTYDMIAWRHPFTASAMPFRADYEVETEGPDGTLDVPSDAYVWDAEGDAWTAVGAGVDATSKVVFDMSKFLLHG